MSYLEYYVVFCFQGVVETVTDKCEIYHLNQLIIVVQREICDLITIEVSVQVGYRPIGDIDVMTNPPKSTSDRQML